MNGYFDHNATTPLLPEAREAWLEASAKHWQNASGLHREGAAVKRKLEEARERLAEILGGEAERIVFTSGATEANNALLHSLALRLPPALKVLSSQMEHPSVREPLRAHFGARVTTARTLPDCVVDEEDLERQLDEGGIGLVTMIAASNETGTLQPWQRVNKLCADRGVAFHTDATQWIGKMPSSELGQCAYVTGSAHKFGGPKGVGFLLLSSEGEALRYMLGGPQEEGRRAGTENYPAVAAMIAALEAVTRNMERAAADQEAWKKEFLDGLAQQLPGTRALGAERPCLWNTVMLVMPSHDQRKWLARLSQRGFQVSTGAACSSRSGGASTLLHSIGMSGEEMQRVLRISSGWETTREDWHALRAAVLEVAGELGR
jgi:cysteine desulfurase